MAISHPQATDLVDRAMLWSLAAKLFAYPDEREPDPATRLALAPINPHAAWPTELAEAMGALERGAEALPRGTFLESSDLAAEHTYLFARQTLAPPRETSYAEGPATAHGAAMADLAAFYKAFGFQASDGLPSDHASVEFAFMAALLAKEAIALEHDWTEKARLTRAARHKFVADHLGRWLPTFIERLETHARIAFYPLVGQLALALARAESGVPTAAVAVTDRPARSALG
ncbi:MAG: hypothetical protein EPO26_17080 [Chloroflexota bacterium]|nr:MAG: hypothetical protein EPO26_17080 [Chloroflexota bacterium]